MIRPVMIALALLAAVPVWAGVQPVLQVSNAGTLQTAAALRDEAVLAVVDEFEVVLWDAAELHVIDRAALPAPDPGYGAGDLVATARPDEERLVLWQQQRPMAGSGLAPRCRLLELDATARRFAPPRALPACQRPESLPQQSLRSDRWRLSDGMIRTVSQEPPRVVRRADGAVSMVGRPLLVLPSFPRAPITGAFVAGDGALVASVEPRREEGQRCATGTRITLWNAVTGDWLARQTVAGRYGGVQWLEGGQALIVPAPGEADCPSTPAPALLMEPSGRGIRASFVAHRQLAPLGRDGTLVALNSAGGLLLRRDRGDWQPVVLPDAGPARAEALGAGHRAPVLAVAGRADGQWTVALYRRGGDGRFVLERRLQARAAGAGETAMLRFGEDDANVMLFTDGPQGRWLQLWRTADGAALASTRLDAGGSGPGSPAGATGDAGTVVIPGGRAAPRTAVLSAQDGRTLAELDYRQILGATILPEAGLLWTIDSQDVIRLFDRQSFALRLTIYRLSQQYEGDVTEVLMVTPDGRYDTNQPNDIARFRWRIDDDPWESVHANTFMRDYFTPGLYEKVLRCTATGTCDRVLPPVPDVSRLKRQVPAFQTDVTQNGSVADVTITDISPPGVEVHDIRVLRDGQLVARFPDREAPADLAGWRAATDARADGQRQWQVRVPLPGGNGRVTLGVYAFNSDRVKSPTRTLEPWLEPRPPRERRAYVVAIGADAYPRLPGMNLNFAAADAEAMAAMLAGIVDHRVVPVVLTSRPGAERARADTFAAVLRRLGGVAQAGDAALLQAAGIAVADLAPATPDDAVILSFAGHGWIDAAGHFHLLASDAAALPDGSPDPATLMSSDALAALLRSIDAGSMAMIIDACHSGASVPIGFKPGPMGDAGLAQLAYDKHIRILAATQADDVAIEDAEAGHGLLTKTLLETRDRLDGPQGLLRLERLLHEAVTALPVLARQRAEAAAARAAALEAQRPSLLVVDGPAPMPRRFQQPQMFDFAERKGIVNLPARTR